MPYWTRPTAHLVGCPVFDSGKFWMLEGGVNLQAVSNFMIQNQKIEGDFFFLIPGGDPLIS